MGYSDMVNRCEHESVEFYDKYGKNDELPPVMEEITEDDFHYYMSVNCLYQYVMKQKMTDSADGEFLRRFYCFVFTNGGGVAFSTDFNDKDDIPKYFKFDHCIHEWKSYSRNCLHTSVCTKCGRRNEIDSGD